jgi:preprotein translocase subunit YajC
MMMFQQTGTEGGQANPLGLLFPFILIFAVFYFMIIRPQSKRQKEHQALVKSLQKGDQVVTAGGLHGTIHSISDESEVVTLEIADKVRVKINRASISRVEEKS